MGDDSIAGRVQSVRQRIASACARSGRSPGGVTLVAVTKGASVDSIHAAIEAGIRHIGENRVQEAEAKQRALAGSAEGIAWHMVGHLQSNKVTAALRLFDIIHSVDSLPLAEAISRRASSQQPIFLEVNVSEEPSKYGFSVEELPERHGAIAALANIEVRGLMTIAPLGDADSIRGVFRRLRQAAEALGLRELSMGMSDDYEIAIEEGATHVRLGRAIFGGRA